MSYIIKIISKPDGINDVVRIRDADTMSEVETIIDDARKMDGYDYVKIYEFMEERQ